jgi:hypothetical protein
VYRDYCGASLGESAYENKVSPALAARLAGCGLPGSMCFLMRCRNISHYKKRYRNLKISLVLHFLLP